VWASAIWSCFGSVKSLMTAYEFINDRVAIFVIEVVGVISERIALNITVMEI